MSQLLTSNCIITFDKKLNSICLLSTSQKDKIIFPTFKIESAKNILNETRYQIKNLFSDENVKFVQDIIISTIDIQNELYIQYLNELGYKYDENNDIIILNSVVLADKYKSRLFWRTYDHMIDIKSKDVFGLLIDHILQKTIL